MNETNDLIDSLLKEHVRMKKGMAHDSEFLAQLEERIDIDERGNIIPLVEQKTRKSNNARICGLGLGIAACVALTFLGYKHWGPHEGNIVLSDDVSSEQLKKVKSQASPNPVAESWSLKHDKHALEGGGMDPPAENDVAPQMMSADVAGMQSRPAAKNKRMKAEILNKKSKQVTHAKFATENKFASSFSKETRLSKFGLNVNNGSYPIIKHMILTSRPVSADVVWIEELVNAFDYEYSRPSGKQPIAMRLDAVDCPWNPNHKLIRVAIQGKSLTNNSDILADDVDVQVEFNPEKVKKYRLMGYDKVVAKNIKAKSVNKNETLRSGHSVTALYEIELGNAAGVESVNSLRYDRSNSKKRGFTSVPAEFANELMFVKLAYKDPNQTKNDATVFLSASLKKVEQWKDVDVDFKFSSAVALFGMILRDSDFKEMGSLEMVEKLAIAGKGSDEKKQREEFIKLVKKLKDRK